MTIKQQIIDEARQWALDHSYSFNERTEQIIEAALEIHASKTTTYRELVKIDNQLNILELVYVSLTPSETHNKVMLSMVELLDKKSYIENEN